MNHDRTAALTLLCTLFVLPPITGCSSAEDRAAPVESAAPGPPSDGGARSLDSSAPSSGDASGAEDRAAPVESAAPAPPSDGGARSLDSSAPSSGDASGPVSVEAGADGSAIPDGGATCSCFDQCAGYASSAVLCSAGYCAPPTGTRFSSADTFPIVPCSSGPQCMGTKTTIRVPTAQTITGIRVYVDIATTIGHQLQVRLESPNGSFYILSSGALRTNVCQRIDQIRGTFPDSLLPDTTLDSLVGTSAEGTWTLYLTDAGGPGSVALKAWALYLD